MPRGRPRQPRRKRREGETWHKQGPHKKHNVFLLCLRCKRGMCSTRFRVHTRICFGFRKCFGCDLPFPCTSRCCPYRFPEAPRIPTELVPYFKDRHKPMTDARQLLERAAIRWFRKIQRKPWSER